MELKLSEKQRDVMIKAYEDIIGIGELKLQEVLKPHLDKSIEILNNFREKNNKPLIDKTVIHIMLNIGQEEAELTYSDRPKSQYFKTADNILEKLKNNDFNFNEKEMYNIKSITDSYSRLGLGQVNNVIRDVFSQVGNVDVSDFLAVVEPFEKINSKMEGFVSINNKELNNEYKVSYDLHQVIRNHLSWKRNPEGGNEVDFDKPKKIGKEPLCYIVDEEKPQIKPVAKSKGGKLKF